MCSSSSALRLLGAVVVALAVACGGGGGQEQGDEGAIRELVNGMVDALEKGQLDRLIGSFSVECTDARAQAIEAIETFRVGQLDLKVSRVNVELLEPELALFSLEGEVRFQGVDQVLQEIEDEPHPVRKENGFWRIADCDLLTGGAEEVAE